MKNEIIRITQEQVIEFERIAEEAPHKERNTAQQEMQKIQKGLYTLTGKGYNSEEITEKIQEANIENIKITTVKKALRNIKKQTEGKKPKQKETKRATQQIKTEKPRETPTEIREVKKQTSPQVNQQQPQRITQRVQEQPQQIKPRIERERQTEQYQEHQERQQGITPQEMKEQDRHIKLRIEQQRQEQEQAIEQEQDDTAEIPFDE